MATTSNNSNSTPEDTVIVQEPTPAPTPTPTHIPVKQTTMEEKIVIETPTEDQYEKAKERQQQEDLEDLNKPDKVQEIQEAPIPLTTEEPVPVAPIHKEGIVNEKGYVFVGIEHAGRQVLVEG
jgi:hypothetical protein